MMSDGADASAAWENPLIPNARLRQIYLSMMRARTLARVLPRRDKATLGLEACLVSPTVDLGPGDVVSDALAGGALDFLRGVPLGQVLQPATSSNGRAARTDSGAAAQLDNPAAATERVWAVIGAAAALKALAARKKSKAAASSEVQRAGVAVVYVLPGEFPAALWQKALTFARAKALPVLFVVLPAETKPSTKTVGVSAIALRCGVPGIPVDKDDAVAIYRVAQESIGHSRIGGGAALMECVGFAPQGAAGKPADPIAGLEQYILQRRVATKAWMERESKTFAKRVADRKRASK
jgi:TPP-dependent pyruvate/acetoin dehydrogenase alpha subunit